MIPKTIHYCWFGRNPKPDIIQKCIESWLKYCPDYEIIEWNEDNFDVNQIPYTRDAYADKKWAFVSDYARLKVVFERGGVYLDTDVLLHSSIDELLNYEWWLASENVRTVSTGLGFGAEKGCSLIKEMYQSYERLSYPATVNSEIDTGTLEKCLPDWKKSDRTKAYEKGLIIGKREYGKYARHLATYSWTDEESRRKRMEVIRNGDSKLQKMRWKLQDKLTNPAIVRFMDEKRGSKLEKIWEFIAYDLMASGVWYFVKRAWRKAIGKCKHLIKKD